MILLTVQNVEVLLGFVVYAGATRACHVRLMPNSSANYVEIGLPLLLVSQLAMRFVSALEVSLLVKATTGTGSVYTT